MTTKVITLKSRPQGLPRLSDFKLVEETVPAIGAGKLLLEAVYISVDPYLRARMAGNKQPRFELDRPLSSKIIAKVLASQHKDFKEGDLVSHYLDWKTLQLSDGTGLVKIA